MTGMALFSGLSESDGRVLEKVRRITDEGLAKERAGAPGRASSHFLRALRLLESQKDRGRRSVDAWSDAYARVGGALLTVGRPDDAQLAVAQALRMSRTNVSALASQGDLYVGQGKPSDALPYYDAALRLDPRAKGVWERRGDAHAALGQRTDAVRSYVQAVNLDPNDVDGYARIVGLLPEDVDMWVRKGDAHRRLGEIPDAHDAYGRALRLTSDRRDALEGKAQLYVFTKEYDKALRCLDRCLEIDRSDPDAWRLRGDVLAAAGRLDDALGSVDEALRIRDGDAPGWAARAELLHRLHRDVDAVAAFDRAIALAPKSVGPHVGRLEALNVLNRWDEVLKQAGLKLEDITSVVATGTGRAKIPFAQKQRTAMRCHAKGARFVFPEARTVIDVLPF